VPKQGIAGIEVIAVARLEEAVRAAFD
jgi:hypothetical protein